MCEALTTHARDRGQDRRRLPGRDPGQGPPDTGAHLAPYTGFAPVTRHSGSSIHGGRVSHGGNKRLERAMFPSTFASLRSDPVSQAYYQRKRDQGKRHNQAALTLAHCRLTHLTGPPRHLIDGKSKCANRPHPLHL